MLYHLNLDTITEVVVFSHIPLFALESRSTLVYIAIVKLEHLLVFSFIRLLLHSCIQQIFTD